MKRKPGFDDQHKQEAMELLASAINYAENAHTTAVLKTRVSASHNVAMRAAIGKLKRAANLINSL